MLLPFRESEGRGAIGERRVADVAVQGVQLRDVLPPFCDDSYVMDGRLLSPNLNPPPLPACGDILRVPGPGALVAFLAENFSDHKSGRC